MTTMTTNELMAAVCPVIRDTGWAFYFAPATLARGKELGLGGMQFYILGRGGVLGDVESSVIASAFGYFNPQTIDALWTSGRASVAPRTAGREYMQCCAAHGRDKLAGVHGLEAFVAAADVVKDAADPSALALYAGIAAEPLANDAPARAMQLITVLREFRGSAHLVALRAVGLANKTAQFIKRPQDAAMFGWTDADVAEITQEMRDLLDEAEVLTDRIVGPAYAALRDAAQIAFADGLNAIQRALAGE